MAEMSYSQSLRMRPLMLGAVKRALFGNGQVERVMWKYWNECGPSAFGDETAIDDGI